MSDILLSYAVSTEPDPLQVSPTLATLTIVVSNDTHRSIDCQSIGFSFLQGTNAKDFFSDSTGIVTSVPEGWSIKQEDARFTALPDNAPAQISADGLTFRLSNIAVNTQVGTTDMTITEVTTKGTGTLDYPLAKFPLNFEVTDFSTVQELPIDYGSIVTLKWKGTTGATYVLRYVDAEGHTVVITHVKDEPTQPLPAHGTYTIENLTRETTFYLIVTLDATIEDNPPTLERYILVDVAQPQPEIALFEGSTDITTHPWRWTLRWDTRYADYCEMSGNVNQLKTSSTDDSYTFEWTRDDPPTASYTLTATNKVGSVTSTLNIDWQLQLIKSVDLGGFAAGIALSPDGSHIYVAYLDKGIKLFDATTLEAVGDVYSSPGKYAATGIAVTGAQPYGRIAVTYSDHSIVIIGALMGQGGSPLPNPALVIFLPRGVAFSSDGNVLYILNFGGAFLTAISAWEPIHHAKQNASVGDEATSVALSLDGKRLYVGTMHDLRVFDAATLQPIGQPVSISQGEVMSIAPSVDGLIYIAMPFADAPLVVLDATTLQPTGEPVPLPTTTNALGHQVAVSPDGMRIYLVTGPVYTAGVTVTLNLFSRTSVTGGTQPA